MISFKLLLLAVTVVAQKKPGTVIFLGLWLEPHLLHGGLLENTLLWRLDLQSRESTVQSSFNRMFFPFPWSLWSQQNIGRRRLCLITQQKITPVQVSAISGWNALPSSAVLCSQSWKWPLRGNLVQLELTSVKTEDQPQWRMNMMAKLYWHLPCH